jgi:hypothetical protein
MKCILKIGNRGAFGQAFHGLDHRATRLHREHQAGMHDPSIDDDQASAANAHFTARMLVWTAPYGISVPE